MLSFQAKADNISEVINELTFINKNGEEMPFQLIDPWPRPCDDIQNIQDKRLFEVVQRFSIPDNFPPVNSNRIEH